MLDGVTAKQVPAERYELAELFLRWNAKNLTYGLTAEPNWIHGGPEFWFVERSRSGQRYVRVQPATGQAVAAFDHGKLAAALEGASGTDVDATSLGISNLTWSDTDGVVVFNGHGGWWEYSEADGACRPTERPFEWSQDELVSPSGEWAVVLKGHDLYLRSRADGTLTRMTCDGERFYDYGTRPEQGRTTVTNRLLGKDSGPMAVWSPSSRRVAFHRIDQRLVQEMHLIQSVPEGGAGRPKLHTYRAALAGDQHVPLVELFMYDVVDQKLTKVDGEPLLALSDSPMMQSIRYGRKVWWADDEQQLFYLRNERGFQKLELHVADEVTGESRLVVEEARETYVDAGPPGTVATGTTSDGKDVVWYSEADGWGHLYRYETQSGKLLNRITEGPWAVHTLEHVSKDGWVYFTAGGREADRDHYFAHLYRARLDGTELELLTPEDAHHEVTFSPDGSHFIDRRSKVDVAPVTTLYRSDGHKVCDLAVGDVDDLLATGWRWPERFKAMANDGETPIYGVMFFPPDFDPTRKYPVVDDIYPGPHRLRAPRGFTFDPAQALAAIGFITVTIDGVGTPYRSRGFHANGCGEHFGRGGGLEDHVAAIRQLAEQRPYMDIDRVGIYGHSAGGYASARAMLLFPDFYKVCVSSGGNHDHRHHRAGWAERWGGLREEQANAPYADQFKGKMLLAYGEIDDTVHFNMTLELIDALIKANKDFDLLVLPNRNHGFYDLDRGASDLPGDPYFIRRRWDYFVRHLIGAEPPADFVIQRPE